MNDDELITLLRSAATGGPAATVETARAVATRSHRMRRRRRAVVGGSAVLSVVAASILAVNLPRGKDETVVQGATPPSAATNARQHNLELLRDALGPQDWTITYSAKKAEPVSVVPKPGSAPARAVPTGDHIQADLTVGFVGGYGSSPGENPTCGTTTDKGVTCSIVRSKSGRPVRVIHSSISYSPGAAFVATHLTARRDDGSVALLDVTVNSPTSSETQARLDQAMAWLKPLDDTLVAVATDPGLLAESRYGASMAQPTPSPGSTADPFAAHTRNMERLTPAFGDGWELQYGYKPQPVAGELTLVKGSSAARGLPADGSAEADIRVAATTSTTLKCPTGGDVSFTCYYQRTADGRDVLFVRYARVSGPEPMAQTSAQYLRPDGSEATLNLAVHLPSVSVGRGINEAQAFDRARTWLKRLDNTLVAAVTNPAMEIDQLPPHTLPECAADAVRLVVGGVDPVVHERHGVLLNLVNTSNGACRLPMMPTVTLLDPYGEAIPFDYAYSSAVARGSTSVVEPNDQSVFSLANHTCAPQQRRAATVTVTLPGSSTPLRVQLPFDLNLSFCTAGDAGSTVTIAPVATAEATPAPR